MKKSAWFLIISALVFSCKNDKTKVQSDLTLENLKGNVWKIDKTVHDANGRCACPAAMKTECNKSQFIYDRKGNLLVSYNIDEEGNTFDSTVYVYSRRGKCLEIIRYNREKLTGKDIPVYSGKKTTGFRSVNSTGSVETTLSYKYSGEEIEEVSTINDKGEIISLVQNEYLNGQLVSQTEKDGNGEIKRINKFRRNDKNDIIEYLIILPGDNSQFKFTYNYEYDDSGNWTKQTRLYDGEIEIIVIRNIEYYSA